MGLLDTDTLIIISIVFVFLLIVAYLGSQNKYFTGLQEGFLTVDYDTVNNQHSQLQHEGESRFNSLAIIQNPDINVSKEEIDQAVQNLTIDATMSTPSLTKVVPTSMGLGGQDDKSNKSGTWLEQTGVLTDKINFCESLPLDCDGFTDPRMSECGFCHKEGVNSKGEPHRGGMFISSRDQLIANQKATASNSVAKYSPTVGKCAPVNFTMIKERCTARENQLQCEKTSAPTTNNRCAQCYGSTGSLLYVGPKPKSFMAYLHISHPGANSLNGVATMINVSGNPTPITLPSSNKMVLDPAIIPMTLKEGDTIRINVLGIPKVWCAWLSNSDSVGTRTVGISVGQNSIEPERALGVIGDKFSSRVRAETAKANANVVKDFLNKVPNNVIWYGRNTNIPGTIISAKYGISQTSGTSVLDQIRMQAGDNKDIMASIDSFGIPDPAVGQVKRLFVKLDNGRSHVVTGGETLSRKYFYSNIKIELTCPATLVESEHMIPEDIETCPSGPFVYTETGSGLMGANSCYTKSGKFDPNKFCLQELFRGAGGTEQGSLYPATDSQAAELVQNVNGKPDLDATSTYLSNLGYIAQYGRAENGARISFDDYLDASMKMLGTSPKNVCEGPNSATGPHTSECLDLLWKTSGDPMIPESANTYNYCSPTSKYAPLNADGTPNEENSAIANDKGGIADVKAYYKSIYDTTRDTTNFDRWADGMADCLNSTVTDPNKVNPVCYRGPKVCRDLGYPSSDGAIRLFSERDCSKIGGDWKSWSGECLKPGGGSYSWDCRVLNSEEPVTGCEGETATLRCNTGVMTGFNYKYGKWNPGSCPGPNSGTTTKVESIKVITPAECVGKQSCRITLGNNWGDPWGGTRKEWVATPICE